MNIDRTLHQIFIVNAKFCLVFAVLLLQQHNPVLCQPRSMKTLFPLDDKDTVTGLGRTKVYVLKKEVRNADIDTLLLEDFDRSANKVTTISNLFEPIRGKFLYFQFIATFKGEVYNETGTLIKDFHDILIIKTDRNYRILDAYQYTLEWLELPLQYDLFRGSAKGTILRDGFNILALHLRRSCCWSKKEEIDNEGGIIYFK